MTTFSGVGSPPVLSAAAGPGPTIHLERSNATNLTVRVETSAPVTFEASNDLSTWAAITSEGTNVLELSAAQVRERGHQFFRARLSGGIYSTNLVGYRYVEVPAGGWALLSNPFHQPNNELESVLGSIPTGTEVFEFNPASAVFVVRYTRRSSGLWTGAGAREARLNSGKGFYLQASGTAAEITFLGEVLAEASVPIFRGYNLLGSPLPYAGRLETDLKFPAEHFDLVLRQGDFYASTRRAIVWTPAEPTLKIGEAFWLNSVSAKVWRQAR